MENYSGIPELSGQANAIARRRKIAEMMMARSQEQQPVNQMAGQVVAPVSWTQGLAQLANAYIGRKSADDADKAEQGLANQRQQMVADQLAKINQTAQGSAGIEGIQAQPERTIQAPAPMQEGQVAPNYGTVPEIVPAVAGREAVPAVAGDKRKAIMDSIMSNLPEVQRYAQVMQSFDTQDANLQEKKDAREENAQNALLLAKEKMADSRATALEKQQAQQEFLMMMQKNNFSQQESMARLAASLRPAPAEQPLETIMVNGVPTMVSRRDAIGKPAVVKGGKGTAMSAASQKELFDTDDAIQGSQQAIKSFDKAIAINDKAMGFTGAGAVAAAGSLIPKPLRPQTVDDTQTLDNILQDSALPQLKAIFGGMPTEGERAILLEVQGSSSKSPAVRAGIFKRAKEAAQTRIDFNKKKAKSLRDGTYFSDDGSGDSAVGGGTTGLPATADDYFGGK